MLLQRSEGGGLGIGGGGGGFMTSRGTANVLTRATAVLAGLFFVTSLMLSILAGLNRKPTSILQGGRPAPTAPGARCAARSERDPRTDCRLRRRPPLRRHPGRRCRNRNKELMKGRETGPSALGTRLE